MSQSTVSTGSWATIRAKINSMFSELYNFFTGNNLNLSRVVLASAPTAAVNSVAGNLNGTYDYCVSFVTATGETGWGLQAEVSVVNQRVNLTNIPISADSSVIARKIYRTIGNPGDTRYLKLLTTINDNTTTIYADNIADGSLGADVPFINTTGGLTKINGSMFGGTGYLTTIYGDNSLISGTGYANTVFGANAMTGNTFGLRNVAIGTDALENNTSGGRNTAAGVHSLGGNTTGSDNTAFGYGALLSSSTVSGLTAVGNLALTSNTTGMSNTAVGYDALQLNTDGSQNTAIGYTALQNNIHGSYNTAVGTESLQNNTVSGNTAFGFQSMKLNTTGDQNVAHGQWSLYSNTDGYHNTVIGYAALGNHVHGQQNTVIGNSAMNPLTTGNQNVAIGKDAGVKITGGSTNLTTASQSIFIGAATQAYADSSTNEVVIGYGTTGLGSNTTVIGNASTTLTKTQGALVPGTPAAVTVSHTGVALGVVTTVTEVTTDGDSDEDNGTLANGVTPGQLKVICIKAQGNAADSFKITPTTMVSGTKISFAAPTIGKGCTLVWTAGGWICTGTNGGVVS